MTALSWTEAQTDEEADDLSETRSTKTSSEQIVNTFEIVDIKMKTDVNSNHLFYVQKKTAERWNKRNVAQAALCILQF